MSAQPELDLSEEDRQFDAFIRLGGSPPHFGTPNWKSLLRLWCQLNLPHPGNHYDAIEARHEELDALGARWGMALWWRDRWHGAPSQRHAGYRYGENEIDAPYGQHNVSER